MSPTEGGAAGRTGLGKCLNPAYGAATGNGVLFVDTGPSRHSVTGQLVSQIFPSPVMDRRKRVTPARSIGPSGDGEVFPRIELREISRLGVVFRAHRRYEAGTSIALGVHICESADDVSPRFLDLEGTVVDCRLVDDSRNDDLCYQVTLLFDGLTEAQSEALNEAAISASLSSRSEWNAWFSKGGDGGSTRPPLGLN